MKRSVLAGLIAGVVVVVLVWWIALYRPASKDLDDAKAQVSSEQSKQQTLRSTLNQLQELARTAPQQAATLRRLNAAVPETPDLASFILQANQIATEAGIDFLAIAPSPPAASATSSATTINLNIQLRGGFFQVLDYLNRLEGLDRVVIIDSVNLGTGSSAATSGAATTSGPAAPADTSGTQTLSVTLTGRMFTRAAPAATPGATPTPAPSTPTTPSTGSGSGSGSTTTTTSGNGSGSN